MPRWPEELEASGQADLREREREREMGCGGEGSAEGLRRFPEEQGKERSRLPQSLRNLQPHNTCPAINHLHFPGTGPSTPCGVSEPLHPHDRPLQVLPNAMSHSREPRHGQRSPWPKITQRSRVELGLASTPAQIFPTALLVKGLVCQPPWGTRRHSRDQH